MNERITLLALKASDPKTGWLDRQKFAQLIVAKCVAQCEFVAGQAEITNKGEMARKTKATADYCAFFIKEYFGVEE